MLVGLVLVALVLLAAASRRSGLPGAVALAAVSVLWLLVNHSAEGPVIWTVTTHHGLAATDLGGLAGLGVAGRRGWQAWRRSTSGRPRGADGTPR